MNTSLDEMGNGLGPDELAVVSERMRESIYQMLSFFASLAAISFSISMMVSTVELWIYGVYSRTEPMQMLGTVLLVVSSFTVFGSMCVLRFTSLLFKQFITVWRITSIFFAVGARQPTQCHQRRLEGAHV